MATATMDRDLGAVLCCLARKVVGGYIRLHPGMRHYYEDMLSDAMLGAVQGASRWDPERESSREDWISRRAYGAMIDGLRDRAPVGRVDHKRGLHVEDLPPQLRPAESLDRLVEAWGQPATDYTDSERPFRQVEARDQADRLLEGLRPKDRYIVMAMMHGVSSRELAAEFAVSEARIFQIRRRALAWMREAHERRAAAVLPDDLSITRT